jgi:hypothetical protein
VEQLKCSSLEWASALPANIILGWKGLPGVTNTLPHYEDYVQKSFITLAPGQAYETQKTHSEIGRVNETLFTR